MALFIWFFVCFLQNFNTAFSFCKIKSLPLLNAIVELFVIGWVLDQRHNVTLNGQCLRMVRRAGEITLNDHK